jgi:hypothetical protein
MIALHKVFSYNKPVYGVLSEYNEKRQHVPPFDNFPFTMKKILKDELNLCKTKSQKEFLSVQYLIKDMNIDDDTFIIKVTGRYVILKDILIDSVEKNKTNKNINAIICLAKGVYPIQQCTFLFAMRWKWFKKFYELSINDLGNKCLERFIIEFIQNEKLEVSIINLDELGILTHINNENKFELY